MQPKIRSAQFVFTRDTAMKMRVAGKMQISAESVNFRTTSPYSAASKNKSTTSAYIASVTFV